MVTVFNETFQLVFVKRQQAFLQLAQIMTLNTGKPPPGGRNQCLTCFLLAVWQSEQMHWRAADWVVGWVASWDGWVGLAALAELARVRAGWRAGRAVQGEIDPRGGECVRPICRKPRRHFHLVDAVVKGYIIERERSRWSSSR